MKRVEHVDVAIVGGGPTGLTVLGEMIHLGIETEQKVLLVDANEIPCGGSMLPKGQLINARTMELWERWGCGRTGKTLTERIEELRRIPDQVSMSMCSWNSTSRQPIRMEQNTGREYSAARAARVPQPLYEGALREFIKETQPPNVQTLFGYKVHDISKDELTGEWLLTIQPAGKSIGHYVELGMNTALDSKEEKDDCEPVESTFQVRAKYVVGCDGGKSTVRKLQGIKLEGKGALGANLTILFKSPTLYENVQKQFFPENPLLYFFKKEGCEAAGFGLTSATDNFYGQVMYPSSSELPPALANYDPNSSSEEMQRTFLKQAVRIFKACVDMPQETLEDIEASKAYLWVPYNLCATSWVVDDSLFLAGDAAHLLSPAGGLGMNGGVADAVALVQYLVPKLRGVAVDMKQYEKERKAAWERYAQFNAKSSSLSVSKGIRDLSNYSCVVFGDGLRTPSVGERATFHADLFSRLSTKSATVLFTKSVDTQLIAKICLSVESKNPPEILIMPELREFYPQDCYIIRSDFVVQAVCDLESKSNLNVPTFAEPKHP